MLSIGSTSCAEPGDFGGSTDREPHQAIAADQSRDAVAGGDEVFFDSKAGESYDWSSNYSNAEGYSLDGDNFLVLYKQSNGRIYVHALGACNESDDTCVGALRYGSTWTSDWTHTIPYNYPGSSSDDHAFLFLLKEGDGDVHINPLLGDAGVGSMTYDSDWSSNWDTVEIYYDEDDYPYLLLLKSGTGDAHVHRLNANGTVGTSLLDTTWAEGWTHAHHYQVGANHYVGLYNLDSGEYRVHQANTNGQGPSPTYNLLEINDCVEYDCNLEPGWENIDFFTTNGQTYMMLMKPESGTKADLYKVNPNGTRGAHIRDYSWTPGWTSAFHYDMIPWDSASDLYRFLIKKSNGVVHLDQIETASLVATSEMDYLRAYQHRAAPLEGRTTENPPQQNTIAGFDLIVDESEIAGLEIDVVAENHGNGPAWYVCHQPCPADASTFDEYLAEIAQPLVASGKRMLIEIKSDGNGVATLDALAASVDAHPGLDDQVRFLSFHADRLESLARNGRPVSQLVHFGTDNYRGLISCVSSTGYESFEQGLLNFESWAADTTTDIDMDLALRWHSCGTPPNPAEAASLLEELESDLKTANDAVPLDRIRLTFTGLLGLKPLGDQQAIDDAEVAEIAVNIKKDTWNAYADHVLYTLTNKPHTAVTNWINYGPDVE